MDHWQALSIVALIFTLGPVALAAAYRGALWLFAPPPRPDQDLARVIAQYEKHRRESRRLLARYSGRRGRS